MTELHTITRRIEIDAGHRVPDHGSKCFNLHGHRYVIEAECTGPLATAGEQRGMVIDFGFLKKAMMECIHDLCDHRFIFAWWDGQCRRMFFGPKDDATNEFLLQENVRGSGGGWAFEYAPEPEEKKVLYYVTDFSPTAENLARHWFKLLQDPVTHLSHNRAQLTAVRVHETPNCVAEYRPAPPAR